MSRRLSINGIRLAYFPEDPGPDEEDSASDPPHCPSCGALVSETEGELFPTTCAACGHETEANE